MDEYDGGASGRVPRQVLDDAAGRATRDDLAGSPESASRTAPTLRRRSRSWLVCLLLIAGAGGAVAVGTGPGMSPAASSGTAAPLPGRDQSRPTPGVGAAADPLGAPAPVTTPSSSYRFGLTQADGTSPVGYDPCRPIHVVVRALGAPAGSDVLIAAAVDNIARATGLTFLLDGATSEQPSTQRESYQPNLYGDRWAPVLIAWDTTDRNPGLAAGVIGLGGSAAYSRGGGPRVYVTGQVELDAQQFTDVLARPQGRNLARAIIQHELAHVVGLAHVDDRAELMFAETVDGMLAFGPGDLTGLAALGRGACDPQL